MFPKVQAGAEVAVSETTLRRIAMKMQKKLKTPVTGDPVNAVGVLVNRYRLNDTKRAWVLRCLIVAGDLTACGLVNAVTHCSQ
jgi:hypothetical protein